MHNKTIAQMADDLARGAYTSVDLTEHFLSRIAQHDGALNSFITVTEDEAMVESARADKRIQAGDAEPLTGIPYAHKDIFCTEGVKTSCGSKMLDNFISPYDASVTHRLKAAGMVMLGKTNMDEFAMGSSNETSYYGPVKNPWDVNCVPGGSSGGSAAAVAERLAPFATGTDTGGSIRQPAALCGITGLKPTYGRVSRYGMVAFASSLDQAGPLTRTAADAALVMQAIAGFDAKDSTSVSEAVPDYQASLKNSVAGLTIGLPKAFFGAGLDAQVGACIEVAINQFKAAGAKVKEIDLPNTHYSVPTYYVVAPAECSSNLSRFDGVRYGHRCKDPVDLTDLYKRSRQEGFGEEVQRRIMIGTYALSAGYYDAYYVQAQKVRRLISQDYQAAFESVDVIMGPTAPEVAFKLGAKTQDPVSMYLSDIYTIAVNLAGLPGISIPAGFANNLPVGLQIIGNYWQEAKLLNVAHQFQQITDWHTKAPASI